MHLTYIEHYLAFMQVFLPRFRQQAEFWEEWYTSFSAGEEIPVFVRRGLELSEWMYTRLVDDIDEMLRLRNYLQQLILVVDDELAHQ